MTFSEQARKVVVLLKSGSRPGRSSFGRGVRSVWALAYLWDLARTVGEMSPSHAGAASILSSVPLVAALNNRRFKVGDDEAGLLGIGIWEDLERMASYHLCLVAEPAGLEQQLELVVAGMALVAVFSARRPFSEPLTERTASRDRWPNVRLIDP